MHALTRRMGAILLYREFASWFDQKQKIKPINGLQSKLHLMARCKWHIANEGTKIVKRAHVATAIHLNSSIQIFSSFQSSFAPHAFLRLARAYIGFCIWHPNLPRKIITEVRLDKQYNTEIEPLHDPIFYYGVERVWRGNFN